VVSSRDVVGKVRVNVGERNNGVDVLLSRWWDKQRHIWVLGNMYDHTFACVELDEVMVFKTTWPAWLRSLF
jgi:hypothetical protein